MNKNVLVLNVDYTPLEVIDWEEAILKMVQGKVELVEQYADQFIRSAYETWPFPAVVRRVGKYVQRKIRLSRKNILLRDGYTCQYCGTQPRKASGGLDIAELTLDHVVPRAQSKNGLVKLPWNNGAVEKVTSWENVVTACRSCNWKKADRTPSEAKMQFARAPRAPSVVDITRMAVIQYAIPEEWKIWLPEDPGNPWADYWTVELDPD